MSASAASVGAKSVSGPGPRSFFVRSAASSSFSSDLKRLVTTPAMFCFEPAAEDAEGFAVAAGLLLGGLRLGADLLFGGLSFFDDDAAAAPAAVLLVFDMPEPVITYDSGTLSSE
jgi:hypothetical protein